MPYAENGGVRIRYEVEGQGDPLVLMHGFSSSMATWRTNGYVARLGARFQLILIDARGHGQSDKPHDPAAYAEEHMVGDVMAVLDALDIRKAHYFGYSMGGHVGWACAKLAPDRFATFVIGGDSPGPRSGSAAATIEVLRRGMDAWVEGIEQRHGPLSDAARAEFLANDPEGLIADQEATISHPGYIHLLPTIGTPTLIVCGEKDAHFHGAQRAVALIPGARFVPLPALDHLGALRRSDLILPAVMDFLAEHALEG